MTDDQTRARRMAARAHAVTPRLDPAHAARAELLVEAMLRRWDPLLPAPMDEEQR